MCWKEKAKPGGSPRMPGIKPKSGQGPARDKRPRKPRPHGFARQRMAPTQRVEHVLESCPQCGTGLAGGWVQRTREVIDLPLVPAQVTEHVFIARTCPVCERRRTPQADLGRVALGKTSVGSQPAQPDCRPAGRRTAAIAHHPVVPADRASVAPEPGRHRPGDFTKWPKRLNRRWRRSWTGSEAAQWCTPTKPAGARTGSTATSGPSAPPPTGTFCAGVETRK